MLDLDGDGLELTSGGNTTVYIDIDGDGIRELTNWVMPDDGLLAYDANGNGMIDGANELFGYGTSRSLGEVADWQSGVGIVLPDGSLRGFNDYELQSFTSGYERLALFDANNDGIISAADGTAFTGIGKLSAHLAAGLAGCEYLPVLESPNHSLQPMY